MNYLTLSEKGQRLVDMYSEMAKTDMQQMLVRISKTHTTALNSKKYVM